MLDRAREYAGQLRAYVDGVTTATDKAVLGEFLHLPVSGLVVELPKP